MTMSPRALMLISLLIGTILIANPAGFPQDHDNSYPLSKGTYWIYRGRVRWFDFSLDKPASTSVVWRTEIEQVTVHGDMVAALVRGFPSELDWSNGHPKPMEAVILRRGLSEIYLVGAPSLSRIGNPRDSLADLATTDNLLFRFPLHVREKYCEPDQMERTDDSYCWIVRSERNLAFDGKNGLPSGRQKAFEIRYVTLPDDTEIEFVSNLGITQYHYHHHGSIADTDVKLSEFHRGEGP
jgi:hypothetical protein